MNFKTIIENVRKSGILVHNITNYVTVNDCANILLAIGAQPIMSDDILEVEEITSICGALNINIGTLNQNTIESMLIAGKKSNQLGHITCLDPVGVGASELRNKTVNRLLSEISFDLIGGNISEIKALYDDSKSTSGVDANENDLINSDNLEGAIHIAKEVSKRYDCIVVITGAIDIVCKIDKCALIYNGNKQMSRITGTGCMSRALISAFLASNKNDLFEAAVTSTALMSICGETSYDIVKKLELGNSSHRNILIDEIQNLTFEEFEKRIKYEIR